MDSFDLSCEILQICCVIGQGKELMEQPALEENNGQSMPDKEEDKQYKGEEKEGENVLKEEEFIGMVCKLYFKLVLTKSVFYTKAGQVFEFY